MIYGTGEFKIEENRLGNFEIECKTIGGWTPMIKDQKVLDYPTYKQAEEVLVQIKKEWAQRKSNREKYK